MSTTDPSSPLNCGNAFYTKSCPLQSPHPIDGYGGPCYHTLFSIPTCNFALSSTLSNNDTDPTAPFLQHPLLNWAYLDIYNTHQAVNSALHGLALALSLLTLLNILVLTPPRKRGLVVHWTLLFATTMQLIRSVIAMYLGIWGPGGASYLQITEDWTGTELSGTWRGLTAVQQVFGYLSVAGVHLAFWCQCRGLLVWVRLKGRRGKTVYRCVLGLLSGIGAFSFVWKGVFVVYQVYWVAFTGSGASLVLVWEGKVWNVLGAGDAVVGGVSFGGWSLVFVVSAGWILWERRRGPLGGGLGGMAGGNGKRRRVQGVCEKALNLIGFVGVESFLIPLGLAITHAFSVTPATDILLVPTILALLPLGSLFIQGNQNDGSPQQDGHAEQLHIISQSDAARYVQAQHNAELDTATPEYRSINRHAQKTSVSAGMLMDRELREIDSMR